MPGKPTYEELERAVKELELVVAQSSLRKPGVGTPTILEGGSSHDLFNIHEMNLADTVDSQAIQSLMDNFYALTGIGVAILDLKGNILVATGWQDICVKFHRVHPETSKNCFESDLELSNGIEPGTFRLYQCKNNMWDMATPIVVGGQKVGNIYLGQFLFKDEAPDVEAFRRQALKHGFDPDEYITALQRVPQWSRQTVSTVMDFYTKLAHLISELGYKNFMLKKSITEKNNLLNSARMSEQKFRQLFNALNDAVFVHLISENDSPGRFLEVNDIACQRLGYTKEELLKLTPLEIGSGAPGTDPVEIVKALKEKNSLLIETVHVTKEGNEIPVESHLRLFDYNGYQAVLSISRDITERKRAEKAARERERYLRSILETTQDGFWVLDTQGKMVDVNEAYCRMSGYTQDELLQLRIPDLDADERPDETAARIERIIKNGSERFETRHRRKDGSVFDVELSVSYQNSDTKMFICFCRDITDRNRNEQALRWQESQYNAIVENSSDYIMRYDRDHRHIFANRRAIEATGLPREQYLGKTHREMGFSENLCALWEKSIDEVFTTGEVRKVDFDVELQNDWMALELQLSPEFGEEGQVNSVIGVSRDVTARKAAQREDRLNKSRLEILHKIRDSNEASEKAICDIALEEMINLSKSKIGFLGFIVDDEQVMRIHAWSSSAMAKCSIQDKPIVFPIDQAGLWGEPVRNRKPIMVNDYTAPHPAKKGTPKGHVSVTRFMSVPVFDGNHIVAVAAVANKPGIYDKIDMDQLNLLMSGVWEQIQRLRMQKEKESLITQLQKVQKMESIGNLAGGIAHDFNNILFPIVGLAELLLEDLPQDSPEYENAQEIFNAGKRGSELVKQILAFSRQSEQKKMPIRIQQILKEVMKLSRSTIPSNIEITQDIHSDCGMVQADPTQVHQIAMNLITNAYHAVELKSGKIAVGLREVEIEFEQLPESDLLPGRYAVLSVSDTGSGIGPEIMNKIFEPYFTTKEQGKGTGLGLAVVYGIVKNHNGDIKVNSELGKGTTFSVYLPIMAKAEKYSSIEINVDSPAGHEHVLLVDDEEPIAKLEKQMLERLGYKVTMRFNSLETLEAFKAEPNAFNMVISDMTMPNLTGERLARELIAIRPDIPIIICTGFSERLDQKKAAAIGVKGFLMKPIVKAEMARMVRKVLDEAKTKSCD